MAKWSVLKEGSAVNSPSHNLIQEMVLDDSKTEFLDNLRSNFFKVYALFLKEVKNRAFIDPLNAKLGDGKVLDLFNLYCIVRGRGGYEMVTQMGKWGSVALNFGCLYEIGASLKLIHFKYLSEFDLWLRDMCFGNEKLDSFSVGVELESGFRSFFSDGMVEESDQRSNFDMQCRLNCIPIVDVDDDDENGFGPKKRKCGDFQQMLEWVLDVAKRSDDPAIGIIPEPSKVPKHGSEELWVQALSVRDALCRKKWHLCPESLSEKKQRMHPSMYEDKISAHPYSERLRYRENLTNGAGLPRRIALCDDSTQNHAKPIEGKLKDVSTINHGDEHSPKDAFTLIGHLFQAEVPEWTGFASESDSKWLGTKVWPLETNNQCNGGIKIESLCNGSIKIEPLGKGRPNSCNCPFRGSVECVRLHIAEKRLELKLELGPVFYLWRFNHMGEDVSLQWTDEEELQFKNVLRVNRSLQNNCFMRVAARFFPKKRKASLVSYYYNAFLLRRRRYQNRVMPTEINSDDDDDSEFGSFGDGFGKNIADVTVLVPCRENRQCSIMEIDETDME